MLRIIAIIYILVGIAVAAARNYFERVDSIRGFISLLIAILVWPVVVFDVDVRIGRDGDGRNKGLLLPLGMMWSSASARVSRLRRSA